MPEKSTQSATSVERLLPAHTAAPWEWVKRKLEIFSANTQFAVAFIEFDDESVLAPDSLQDAEMVVVRLQNRDFARLNELTKSLQSDGKTQVIVMLEDWLQGFRRLLPQGLEAFYWYEIYRVCFRFLPKSKLMDQAAEVAKLSPHAARRPIFCFGNHAETRRSICDSLNAMDRTCVALECCSTLPAGKPELVIWLAEWESSQIDREREFLKRLRIAYPDCIKFRVTEFPRFEASAYFLNNGIDLEIGTPYDLAAVLETASLFSSAALRRK